MKQLSVKNNRELNLKENIDFIKMIKIIRKYCGQEVEILLFGSRAKGTERISSDYDICLRSDKRIGIKKLYIIDDLEESNIPYKFDILDYNELSEEFKNEVDSSNIKWKD